MDDSTVWVAVVGAIASIGVAIITSRFASKSANKAAERAERTAQQAMEAEKSKVDAQAFARARENYEAALSAQEKRITRLTREAEEDREEYRRDIAECRAQIAQLQEGRRTDQQRIRAFVTWARQVIPLMNAHEIEYPLPPALDDV